MRSKALLELKVADAHAFLEAVKHEKYSKRVKTSVSAHGNFVRIRIEAEDATSLRATLNTYLRIAQSTEEIEEG